ncbi:hypothetical protein MHK_006505, partial [Candidatus Magnetomorum sp. HK-1]
GAYILACRGISSQISKNILKEKHKIIDVPNIPLKPYVFFFMHFFESTAFFLISVSVNVVSG